MEPMLSRPPLNIHIALTRLASGVRAACSGYALVNGELKEGYAINPVTNEPEYVIGLKCTCCRCWVTPPEVSRE